MNKQELLDDLKSKEWCDSLNGIPELKEVKADGGKWYLVNIREIQGGNVGIYRNIHFYVIDEGLESEIAYYKDAVPTVITDKEKTFSQKITGYADTHDNITIEKIEEERNFAIVKRYVETVSGATEKRYLVKEIDGVIKIKEVV